MNKQDTKAKRPFLPMRDGRALSVRLADGVVQMFGPTAGETIEGLYGLLGFNLEPSTSLEEAMRIADLMNSRITSLTLTK